MKIFLAGHEGRYNRGCEAIIRSTQLMLRQGLTAPQFILSSFEYADDGQQFWGDDTKVIPAMSSRLWKKYTCDWFLAKFLRRISQDKEWDLVFKPLAVELDKSDVVLSVGGDNYTDDYVNYCDPIRYYLQLNRFVKKRCKKLVIWGASVGPFKQKDRLKSIVECLNLADLLTIRESRSFKYLTEIGVKNIRQVADPAFILPAETVDAPIAREIEKSPYLAFNISPLVCNYLVQQGKDYVLRECANFLDGILKKGVLKVLLLPHVVKQNSSNNDRVFMKQLKQFMVRKEDVYLLEDDYNCSQLKYLLSKCKYFIGARTHATIAALSQGIPTLSIGYSQKSIGINEDIFGHLDYLLDIKEFSAVRLRERFEKLVSSEEEIRKKLAAVIPAIRSAAMDNCLYLRELMNGK